MRFDLSSAVAVLERTPATLRALLTGLPEPLLAGNEGPDTWSPYDVVGHLIHGERTDWMTRLAIILSDGPDKRFAPFDRFAQSRESRGTPLPVLLDEFAEARAGNLGRLRALNLTGKELDRTGIHPQFGTVTARQLLATWTAHDLDHLMQVSRALARRFGPHVGPWVEYLRIVRDPI